MKLFSFRDLMHHVGIPLCNENNWAVGQWLVSFAAKRGVEPQRILAEKTNPNPTVAAPHCIAHYPMHLFDEARDSLAAHWNGKAAQLSLQLEDATDARLP